jgi:flagellar biosynthesis GTPase FlhF
VLIDTAGRLHNKTNLMDELGKVKRVIEKQSPIDEVLLVLDATTGQNGLEQAKVFSEVVDVTGIVLTKLDGTAKGGIVVAVQRKLGVPVKLVGLGEGPDDLAPFDPDGLRRRGILTPSLHTAHPPERCCGATASPSDRASAAWSAIRVGCWDSPPSCRPMLSSAPCRPWPS